ncbi:hypothetical protein BDN70DRAFT_881735 [Pholiota conissans]|uniref:Uncharacterized protein n=1 Tax=Pholiota conissans TaxID=109636 RepID=A0A9P5YZY7_9AGAR|nr:hypothetical protein BDN70DRAFT_881735 [Pholiota conissans]
MASAQPVVFHHIDAKEHRHHTHHAEAHHAKTHLPVIPDLRFESSYIRSVRRYIEVERVGGSPTDADVVDEALRTHYETLDLSVDEQSNYLIEEKEESAVVVVPPSAPREIIRVQWKSVVWVTVRDQVISPLLQGALWALASYYITPFSSQLGSRMGTFVHKSIPTKEGLGVTWLRNWAKNIGFSNNSNVTSTAQRTTTSSNYRY